MSGETSFLGRSNLSKETADRLTETYKQEYALQSALYPTLDDTPSCTDLMYKRMNCVMGAGNHRHHFYLTGEIDRCQRPDQEFKKCWKEWAKIPSKPERRDAWIRYRAEMWTERRVGPSSEDIWKVRKTPLEDFPPRLDDESMALFKQHMEGTVPKSDPIASEPIA